MFYVISSSEGDVSLEAISRETLLSRLNEDYWGERPTILKLGEGDRADLTARECVCIIEGDVKVPKPVRVVHEWDI